MSLNESIIYFFLNLRSAVFPSKKYINRGYSVCLKNDSSVHLISENDYLAEDIEEFITKLHKKRVNDKFIIVSKDFQEKDDFVSIVSLNNLTITGGVKPELKSILQLNSERILLSYLKECNKFDELIINNINASFKAGVFNTGNMDLFDLTLKDDKNELFGIFENFEFYLNTLNINK